MSSRSAAWRLFFAVEVPEEVREAALQVRRALNRAVGGVVKWVEKENMHLTLRFIGEVAEQRVGEAIEAGRVAALAGRPCKLTIRGAGAFPNPGRPRVLWLGVEGEVQTLATVARELDHGVVEAGLSQPENRPFAAHLTLGRVRRGRRPPDVTTALAEFAEEQFGSWLVEDFVLMRSHLGPQGPKYEVIERFVLPGGNATTWGE